MKKSIGIEGIKKVLDFVFAALTFATELDRNRDGKISASEAFSILTSGLLLQLPTIFNTISATKAEVRDLTPEEVEELAVYVTEQDFLPAQMDDLEEFIKRTVNWIVYNYRYIAYARKYMGK